MSSSHIALITNAVNAPGGGPTAIPTTLPTGITLVNAIVIVSPGGAAPPVGADVVTSFSGPTAIPAATDITVSGTTNVAENVLFQPGGTFLGGTTILLLYTTP
jgi:hypothetical protein